MKRIISAYDHVAVWHEALTDWGKMPDIQMGAFPTGPSVSGHPASGMGSAPASSGVGSSAFGGGGTPHPSHPGTASGSDTGGSILPDTQTFKDSLQKQFPNVTNIGGYRPPDGFNEHSSGHALDVMIPDSTTQNQVRNWALQQPNVNYVLNQQAQWNPDGSSSRMPDRGSPTENHMDHLHVNVAGQVSPMPSGSPNLWGDQQDQGSDPSQVTPMTVARRQYGRWYA